MLLIDKYPIESLDDVIYNRDVYQLVELLAKQDNIPHLIITGGAGIGKKSLVDFYIRCKYSLPKVKTNICCQTIKCSNKKIEYNFLYSNYHHLIDPSRYGVYDKHILQHLLNDILKYRPIIDAQYHLIVVNNADQLTIESQQSLRRTLEKFVNNCRFIFLTNSHFSMIEPIRSRCLTIKLALPTRPEIRQSVCRVLEKENIPYTADSVYRILANTHHNVREAVNLTQMLHTFGVKLTDSRAVSEYLYQNDNCFIITNLILSNIKLDIKICDLIKEIRVLTQSMLVESANPSNIIKKIFLYLFEYFSNGKSTGDAGNTIICKHLTEITNRYLSNIKNGNKPIYFIEGYCLEVYNLLYHLTVHRHAPTS